MYNSYNPSLPFANIFFAHFRWKGTHLFFYVRINQFILGV